MKKMNEKSGCAYEKIIYEKKGEVCWVTFNDVKKFNAMTVKMQDELIDVLKRIEVDDQIKCVVITGAGEKAFSSGGDITSFDLFFDRVKSYNFVRNHLYQVQRLITNTEKIFIAAINGLCFAGGLELALCCDFRIASENAKTGVLEINLGLIPGMGGTARLAQLLPKSTAKMLLMTGDIIDAQEACRISLFDKVVSYEKLHEVVNELANKICSKPFLAIRRIKTGVNRMAETPGEEAALEIERGIISHLAGSDDNKEGVNAFLEKRPAVFKGK